MNKLFFDLKEKIENAENIIIFSHVSADGDTLGSNLALSLMIEKYFNKKVTSVYSGSLPGIYTYLPDYNRFINEENVDKVQEFDLAIAVDVAAKDRLVNAAKIFDKAKYRINIDHHATNIGFADLNIIEPNAACVGIILQKIFKEWDLQLPLDVARCLYTSLMTDTGAFKYETTTPEVFRAAADLVEAGVSPTKEFRACYEAKPQAMIEFQAYILSKAEFLENGKIGIAQISQADVAKFNAADDYSEGIVEVLRSSKNVEISAVLKETKEGNTKVSLRSKAIDLTRIATIFDGGGHKFAAGCTIKKPLKVAYNKLLEVIKSEL